MKAEKPSYDWEKCDLPEVTKEKRGAIEEEAFLVLLIKICINRARLRG